MECPGSQVPSAGTARPVPGSTFSAGAQPGHGGAQPRSRVSSDAAALAETLLPGAPVGQINAPSPVGGVGGTLFEVTAPIKTSEIPGCQSLSSSLPHSEQVGG